MKCDCIAYQADTNCRETEGCRCGEVFLTSAPCTCGHDFEDHESDEHGTGGACGGGQTFLVDHGPVKPPYGSPEREAYDDVPPNAGSAS